MKIDLVSQGIVVANEWQVRTMFLYSLTLARKVNDCVLVLSGYIV